MCIGGFVYCDGNDMHRSLDEIRGVRFEVGRRYLPSDKVWRSYSDAITTKHSS